MGVSTGPRRIWEMIGPIPLEMGVSDPPKRPSSTFVTIPNFVALAQTKWASVQCPEKFWRYWAPAALS